MSRNIEHEIGILWLEDRARYPYLREFTLTCTARRGWRKVWACGNHVVAIAEVSKEAQTCQRRLARRAWHFRADADPYPKNDKPCEAVIPESITPRQESAYGRKA